MSDDNAEKPSAKEDFNTQALQLFNQMQRQHINALDTIRSASAQGNDFYGTYAVRTLTETHMHTALDSVKLANQACLDFLLERPAIREEFANALKKMLTANSNLVDNVAQTVQYFADDANELYLSSALTRVVTKNVITPSNDDLNKAMQAAVDSCAKPSYAIL